MTAFLKIDTCRTCQRSLPWEWVPTVLLNGKALAGTGVWRSQLADGRCPTCIIALEAERDKKERDLLRRKDLIRLLGGEKPYREFTFERYGVTPENRLAYEKAVQFNPDIDSLYLWGPCGVGKTHLAWSAARRCFEETMGVTILRASQISRRLRMKDPVEEQAAIDQIVGVDVLVVDDLGGETAYAKQILQEVLDERDHRDRAGLIVTSAYSLDGLAHSMGTDTIASRLAGMCAVIEVRGDDHRVRENGRR